MDDFHAFSCIKDIMNLDWESRSAYASCFPIEISFQPLIANIHHINAKAKSKKQKAKNKKQKTKNKNRKQKIKDKR
jgi:hypothetical protein